MTAFPKGAVDLNNQEEEKNQLMDNANNIRCITSLINVLYKEIGNETLRYDVRSSASLSRALCDRTTRQIRMMDMVSECFPVKDAFGCTFPYPTKEDLVVAYHLIKGEMGI